MVLLSITHWTNKATKKGREEKKKFVFFFSNVSAKDGMVKKIDIWV